MSSTQDVYSARDMLAEVLGMPVEKVRVQYYEGSGTFGRSCYGTPGKPPPSCRKRSAGRCACSSCGGTSMAGTNFGPAHVAEVRAGIDADGKLVAYEYHGWQHGWTVTSSVYDISRLQKPGRSGPVARPIDHGQSR